MSTSTLRLDYAGRLLCVPAFGLLAGALAARAQAPLEAPRLETVATGVYVLHNPRANESWPQGNTVIVVGDRAALVVDADYLPGTARADIDIIRRLTDKPVRYLVNTHWHYDHTNGNYVYRAAFPGLSIIAHPETRRLLRENAPRYLASVLAPESPVRKSVANSKKVLADLAAKGDTTGRALYQQRLAQRELELREIAQVHVDLPDLLVEHELTIDLGGREVVIRHLGRGNTPGDLVIWLPQEHIIATGDIVVSPMPYAYNSSPGSWLGVLDAILALQPRALLPGHGEVQRPADAPGAAHAGTGAAEPANVAFVRSLDYTRAVRDMIADVVDRVRTAYRAGKTEDEARASIDFTAYLRRLAGEDEFLQQVFTSSIVTALVDRAWAEAGGGT